jgi:predicted protein tyrosine phosphatase
MAFHVVLSDFHHSDLKDDGLTNEGAISQISPRIWISNWENGISVRTLRDKLIKAVLHLGDKIKKPEQLLKYRELGIDHRTIVIEDKLRERLSEHFGSIWDFMSSNASKNILIHCSTGNCRAAAAVLYYMVRRVHTGTEKPTKPITDKLLKTLMSIRPCININSDFLNQIRAYECNTMGIEHSPETLTGLAFLRASGGDEMVKTITREVKEVVVSPSE